MAKKSKQDMIRIMKENGWNPSTTIDDSYEDVLDEFDTYKDETSSDIDMFPNGRDYDAEDENGPF